jgi:hypothetical protein
MNPEIARTLTEQRRGELARYAAGSRRGSSARPGWLSRHLPRWHVSWSRTVLSPAASPGHAAGGYPDRRGSSLVIIISAHR